MYLPREEEPGLFGMLGWKEALALIGPRQAGKITLALRLLEHWREQGGTGMESMRIEEWLSKRG